MFVAIRNFSRWRVNRVIIFLLIFHIISDLNQFNHLWSSQWPSVSVRVNIFRFKVNASFRTTTCSSGSPWRPSWKISWLWCLCGERASKVCSACSGHWSKRVGNLHPSSRNSPSPLFSKRSLTRQIRIYVRLHSSRYPQ